MSRTAGKNDYGCELILTDRVVKLVEDGVDVAVRIADLSDSALHAVRLTEIRRVLVASPAYLEARGVPTEVAHLHDHDLIVFDGFAPNGEWRFGATGKPAIHVEARLMTNNVSVTVAAAVAGRGIARVLCYQVAEHIAQGALRHVLSAYDPPAVPVSLVFQANRRGSPNVRTFLEAAKARFAPIPVIDCGPDKA